MPTQDEYNSNMAHKYPQQEIARLRRIVSAHAADKVHMRDISFQSHKLIEKLRAIVAEDNQELKEMTKKKDHFKQLLYTNAWRLPPSLIGLPKVQVSGDLLRARKRMVEQNVEINRLQVKLAGAASEIDNGRAHWHDASNFTAQVQQDLRAAKKHIDVLETKLSSVDGEIDKRIQYTDAALRGAKKRIDEQNKFINKGLEINKALEERVRNQREVIIQIQNKPMMMVCPDGTKVEEVHHYHHHYPRCRSCNHDMCKS